MRKLRERKDDDMEKDKEIELKVKMFCAAVQSHRQLCQESRLIYLEGFANQINKAFEILKKG